MRLLKNVPNKYIKISQELINTIERETDHDREDICFNLLVELDSRISQKNIDAFKRRKAFGLYRVIKYPGTLIKCKCKFVMDNNTNPAAHEGHNSCS